MVEPYDPLQQQGEPSPEFVDEFLDDPPAQPGPNPSNLRANRDYLADVQAGLAPYTQPLYEVRYEYFPGIAVMQPMNADGPGEVVRLHSPGWTAVLEFSVERENLAPEVPHPDVGDPNWVLTYASVQPAAPLDGPDGQRAWRLSGRYVYSLLNGLQGAGSGLSAWGPFPSTTHPASKATSEENTVPPSSFSQSWGFRRS
jgi:hypothetical protein